MERFMANSLDSQYQQLLQDIIDFGVDKQDRTGTGTKSIFGYTIQWAKSTAGGSLSASTTFGYIDQIQNLINDLKTNPDSRRLMVSAWNVGELDQLPPCHYGFQVYTRELSYNEREQLALQNPIVKELCEVNGPMTPTGWDTHNIPTRAISLMWNQRSVDTFLGLPFNIASYGLLLEIIAREVNMMPYHLIGHLGDTHLYSNHIEQAKEQISRESKDLLPTLKMSSGHNFRAALKGKVDEIDLNDFIL
jgi:thymidylate synthase